MNKIVRMLIVSVIMISSIMIFTGCGLSDKFEGRWTTDIIDNSMGFKIEPEVRALEVKKNGDKDYIIKYYKLYYDNESDTVKEAKPVEATAQKGESDNTIKILQGLQPVITYNEENKCLQFVPNAMTGKMETFKLVKDDKAYQDIKEQIKKANKEQAAQKN